MTPGYSVSLHGTNTTTTKQTTFYIRGSKFWEEPREQKLDVSRQGDFFFNSILQVLDKKPDDSVVTSDCVRMSSVKVVIIKLSW